MATKPHGFVGTILKSNTLGLPKAAPIMDPSTSSKSFTVSAAVPAANSVRGKGKASSVQTVDRPSAVPSGPHDITELHLVPVYCTPGVDSLDGKMSCQTIFRSRIKHFNCTLRCPECKQILFTHTVHTVKPIETGVPKPKRNHAYSEMIVIFQPFLSSFNAYLGQTSDSTSKSWGLWPGQLTGMTLFH